MADGTEATARWPQTVAVIGAGAMGSIYGSAFQRAGARTTLVDRREDHVAAINESGLAVEQGGTDHKTEIAARRDADGLQADLVIVLVGSDSTRSVAETAARTAGPTGAVITLQNGIGNAEALAECVPHDQLIVGSTYNSGAYLGPGRVAHTNVGPTIIGSYEHGVRPRDTALAERMSEMGFPTTTAEEVMGHVWLKFTLNCALNPVCAATGFRPGEVMRTPPARALLDSIVDEIVAVVDAKGMAIPVSDLRHYILEHAFTRYNRPSMLQHVEAGIRPELSSLNDALVAEADALGVRADANRTLSKLVYAISERHRARREAPQLDEAALEAAAQKEVFTG
ncbi:MAG: ketopantoate reductase family protein [Pseudomonadota bacterium]